MTKEKKYLFLILIITIALLILAGCGIRKSQKDVKISGTNRKEEDTIVIGVTLASSQANYIDELSKYILEVAKEEEIELIMRNASWDAQIQESHMEEFVSIGVDAIILSPINIKSMLIPLKNAYDEDIPVININMKVDAISSEYIATYVGSSSSEQARFVVEMFIDALGEEGGKIAVIEGAPGSDPQIYRTLAFIEQLVMRPQFEIIDLKNGQWNRQEAYRQALELLKENSDIKGIYCHDSNMAMGVIEALEELNMVGEVIVVGISEGEEYAKAIKDGVLYGFVTQPPEFEARNSVYCAIKAAKGEALRPWYKDPIEIVTIDNIDNFIFKKGYKIQ